MSFFGFSRLYADRFACRSGLLPVASEPTPVVPRSKSFRELLDDNPACRRKFRLWQETMGECIYCGAKIDAEDFVRGADSDIEHIIPQAMGGGSRLDNIACACRDCNREKANMTAIDFMMTRDPYQQQAYLERLRRLAARHLISRQKYLNLLLPASLIK